MIFWLLFQEGRYCYKGTESLAVRGKISLARKGLNFAKAQIAQGVAMFKAATKGDFSEFEFADSNIQHFGDDDEESDSSELEWDDIGAELGENIVKEPSREVEPVSLVDGDVYSWMFPPEFCQSSIDGRNGSNACSLISLAVSHSFLTVDISLPRRNHLPSEWTKFLYLCMRLGNVLYDNARHSLPHRYLNAGEAAQLFNTYASVKLGQTYPVRVCDQHSLSTIEEQLRRLATQNKRSAAIFIYDDKTVTFLVSQHGTVAAIDSHCHPPYGAAIVTTDKLGPPFVTRFQDIVSLNVSTFGNFTVVDI